MSPCDLRLSKIKLCLMFFSYPAKQLEIDMQNILIYIRQTKSRNFEITFGEDVPHLCRNQSQIWGKSPLLIAKSTIT